MDIFDSHYFSVNKVLLKTVGLWIHQDRTTKISIQFLFIGYLLLSMAPHYYGIYKNYYISVDIHKTLIHITSILYFTGSLTKYVTTIAAQKKLLIVFKFMANNWIELKENNERIILAKYTTRGRTLVIFYATCIMLALMFYLTGPLVPFVLDIVYPLENGTRPLIYVLYGEYGIDPMKNYSKIYLIEATFCIAPAVLVCAVDTTYAACIEHCLALFAVVSFANQLELSYSTSFLFLILMNGLYITFLSVLIIESKNDIKEQFRFVATLITIVVHLFYLFWPGQKMIDYSTGLFNDVYSNDWYKYSIKTQNLLRFMTLRCIIPCYVTAGGVYIMNFINFASIVKTSVSYIAVLASFT